MRDEVGFLALHQAYANRFFPGTSVLHTRLRYVLFVPWIYQRLAERVCTGRIDIDLEYEEVQLAGRLNDGHESGVIGGRSWPKPAAQPPSMAYWTALGTWGILKPLPDGSLPSRATVHRQLARQSSPLRLRDDDQHWLEESLPLFATVPAPPDEWQTLDAPLTFELRPNEATFLRNCLIPVTRSPDGASSLLARLADAQVVLSPDEAMFGPTVTQLADEADHRALRRARQVAELAAIGRAVYATLVEWMLEKNDGVITDRIHHDDLANVMKHHGPAALELNIDEILDDAPDLGGGILKVLDATQDWLKDGRFDTFSSLHPVYAEAERRRKGARARLTNTLRGKEKRDEWNPAKHPAAEPLHYRWTNVRRLLLDLEAAT